MSKDGFEPKNDGIGSTMETFVKRVKESTETMEHALASMEKENSESITLHFGKVNESYQANKDLVNDFIVLIYNQIKNTFESNFQIFKNQAQRIHENDIFVMKSNQKAFTSQLEETFKKFETTTKKLSRDMQDAFGHLKKAKLDSVGHLVDELEHRLEFLQLQSLSGLSKILDEFSTTLMNQARGVNKDVRDKFKVTSKFYRDGFQNFTNQVIAEFFQLVRDHEERSEKFKEMVKAEIAKLAGAFKAAERDSIQSIVSLMQFTSVDLRGKVEAQQARVTEGSGKCSDGIDSITCTLTRDVESMVTSLGGSRAELDQVLKSEKPDGARLKKEIENVIGIVDVLMKSIKEHRDKMQSSNENVKGLIKAETISLSNETKQLPVILQKATTDFKKTLDKKHDAINEEFLSNMQELAAKSGLFVAIDDHLTTIKSLSEKVSTEFGKFHKAYDDVVEKATEQLEKTTTGVITKLGGSLKADLTNLEQQIQEVARLNLETVKSKAATIATENGIAGKIEMPALKDATTTLIDTFSKGLVEISGRYQAAFTGAYGPLFSSFDDMVARVGTYIKDYGEHQHAIVRAHESENRSLIAIMEESREAQMREFNDRLELDLNSLLGANQELISRIMIKSAETGSEFMSISDECLKQSEESLKSFIEKVQSTVSSFLGAIK